MKSLIADFLATKKGIDLTPRMSFKVVLRLMPDYGADVDGIRVAKVTAGGPADKAGIEAGDVIVRFGETPVHSVRDYMVGLQNATGDKPVPVQVKRGEKKLTVMVGPTEISHSAH